MDSTREGTKALQKIAEDVEQERAENGQTAFDPDGDESADDSDGDSDMPMGEQLKRSPMGAANSVHMKNSPGW